MYGLKKRLPLRPLHTKLCKSMCGPGSNDSQSSTDGNFASLWPTDFVLSIWKDLNPHSLHFKSSRGWQHFNDRCCFLKMASYTQGLFSNRLLSKFHSCVLKILLVPEDQKTAKFRSIKLWGWSNCLVIKPRQPTQLVILQAIDLQRPKIPFWKARNIF